MDMWSVRLCFFLSWTLQLTNSYGPDFNRLKMAVDNLLNDNQMALSTVKSFEANLHMELGRLWPKGAESADWTNQPPAFQHPADFYLHRNFNADFVATSLSVIGAELVSGGQLSESVVDIDDIEVEGQHHLLITFAHSFALYPVVATAFEPRDVINVDVELLSSALFSFDDQLFIFVLNSDHDVTIYKWNSTRNIIEPQSKHKVDDSAFKLSAFQVPLTGSALLTVVGWSQVTVYVAEVDSGHLELKPCDEMDASGGSDVTAFSINGQLYVGVANARFRASHLWKFKSNTWRFVFHQSLNFENATKLNYFRRGFHHFLLVSNPVESALYGWEAEQLVLRQRFSTSSTPTLIINYQTGIYVNDVIILPQAVVWSQRRRKFVPCPTAASMLTSLELFSHWFSLTQGETVLMYTASRRRINVYKIDIGRTDADPLSVALHRKLIIVEKKLDELQRLNSENSQVLARERQPEATVERKCVAERQRLDDVSSRLTTLEHQLKDVGVNWRVGGERRWEWVEVSGRAEVKGRSRLDAINGYNVSRLFNDAVRKSGRSLISGRKVFARDVKVEKACHVGRLNGRRIPDDYVITSIPQQIKSTWKFASDVTVDGDVEVKLHLNSIDISNDVIRIRGNQTQIISGSLVTFSEPVTVLNEVVIDGQLNGFKIGKMAEDVMTSEGDRTVFGRKWFRRLKVNGDVEVERVNGADLKQLERKIAHNDSSITVTAPKVIKGHLLVDGPFQVKTINGYRFPDDFVIIDRDAVHVRGLKRFAGQLTVDGDLTVDGQFGGVRLNNVFTIRGQQNICGGKTFLDIVTRDVVVSGQKDFDDVRINGRLNVADSINGVDIKQFYNDVVHINAAMNVTFFNSVTFTQPQTLSGDVTIAGLVNGFHLIDDFVRVDKINVIGGKKTFLSPIVFDGDVKVTENVGGFDLNELRERLVSRDGEHQLIRGVKTYINGMNIGSLTIDGDGDAWSSVLPLASQRLLVKKCVVKGDVYVRGQINEHPFEEIASDRITLSTEQELRSTLTLKPDCVVHRLIVNGRLNQVDIDEVWRDVLWRHRRHQLVTGRKIFNGKLLTPAVVTRDGVNGIFMPRVAARTVSIDAPTISAAKINVRRGLVVEGDVNGYNVSRVFKEALDVTRLNVNGFKTFDALRLDGSLWVSGDVNGINIDQQLLTINTEQNVTGNLTLCNAVTSSDGVTVDKLTRVVTVKKDVLHLNGDVSVDEFYSGNDLNGVNVTWLWRDAVKRWEEPKEGVVIGGSKTLKGNVRFEQNLDVIEGINGYNYAERLKSVVTRDGSWVIGAAKEFRGDVIMEGSVNVESALLLNGSVNGVSVTQDRVIEDGVTIYGSVSVNGGISAHKTIASDDGVMSVTGDVTASSVNGLNLSQLYADTLLLSGDDQRVTGHKVLKGLVHIAREASPPRGAWLHFSGRVTFGAGLTVATSCPINVTLLTNKIKT